MDGNYKYQELKDFIKDNKERVIDLSNEGSNNSIIDSDVEELALFIKEELGLKTMQTEYARKLIATYEYMSAQVDNDGNSMFYDWSNGKEFRKDFH